MKGKRKKAMAITFLEVRKMIEAALAREPLLARKLDLEGDFIDAFVEAYEEVDTTRLGFEEFLRSKLRYRVLRARQAVGRRRARFAEADLEALRAPPPRFDLAEFCEGLGVDARALVTEALALASTRDARGQLLRRLGWGGDRFEGAFAEVCDALGGR
jgi:hypothetical protein